MALTVLTRPNLALCVLFILTAGPSVGFPFPDMTATIHSVPGISFSKTDCWEARHSKLPSRHSLAFLKTNKLSSVFRFKHIAGSHQRETGNIKHMDTTKVSESFKFLSLMVPGLYFWLHLHLCHYLWGWEVTWSPFSMMSPLLRFMDSIVNIWHVEKSGLQG